MRIKEALMTDSSYYQVYKFLPWTNAKEFCKMALMSMLIDADSFASERLKDDYNFFMCTNEFIKRVYKANWSDNTINTYFNELAEEHYIETKKVEKAGFNYPPRYVKINNQILMDMYQNLKDVPQNLKDVRQNLLVNNNIKQELEKELKQDSEENESATSLIKQNKYKNNIQRTAPTSDEPLPERSDLEF